MSLIDINEVLIRPEASRDYDAITRVNDAAFMGPAEGRLVAALRQNLAFVPDLSRVALYRNEVLGHLVFFPIEIDAPGQRIASLALASISVLPKYQKQGIGAALLRDGLVAAREVGYFSVIVLGHPEYFSRFGFKSAAAWNIVAPFEVPSKAFMAYELLPGSLKNAAGTVEYPPHFSPNK